MFFFFKLDTYDINSEEPLFEIPLPSPLLDEPNENDETLEISFSQDTPGCSTAKDWSSYSPALLRTPRAPLLEVCFILHCAIVFYIMNICTN